MMKCKRSQGMWTAQELEKARKWMFCREECSPADIFI
jgi:hypothetical protein